MRLNDSERGAAAVEFALILIPLLMLIFVLVDLGWIFNRQLAVTSAAREAVRVYAVEQQGGDAGARTSAENRASALVDGGLTFEWDALCPTSGGSGADASVRVSTPLTDLTGWVVAIAPGSTLSARGTMRCGG